MRTKTIDGIKILIGQDIDEATRISANVEMEVVKNNPLTVITYATGNTQIPVYEKLAEAVENGAIDFSQTTALHLDEYYPCGDDLEKYPYGFVVFLRKYVFEPLKIKRVFELNGAVDDPEKEVLRYDQLLTNNPRGLTILGIGPWSVEKQRGCHIAFTESGTPFDSRVHVVNLDPITVARDRQERGQDSPDRALTQGLANIMESKKIVLNAFGQNYAQRIYETLYGEIGVLRPSTVLRTQPQKVTIVLDEASASLL